MIKEQMANKVHEIWSSWMSYVFSVSKENEDGGMTIPKEMVTKWSRQIATPYEDLPMQEKVSDKIIAEEILLLVQGK